MFRVGESFRESLRNAERVYQERRWGSDTDIDESYRRRESNGLSKVKCGKGVHAVDPEATRRATALNKRRLVNGGLNENG
jgi:hypothetical protein